MILACGIVRMADTADRYADETPRRTRERRWEVFVRESESDPMRRVGTVAAPSPDVAHEEATGLFGWYARDVWLCPADETHRFSTYSLGDAHDTDADQSDAPADSEPPAAEETTRGRGEPDESDAEDGAAR